MMVPKKIRNPSSTKYKRYLFVFLLELSQLDMNFQVGAKLLLNQKMCFNKSDIYIEDLAYMSAHNM